MSLLNFCIYFSTVNQTQFALSVCDMESSCTSQIIYISEVNIIKRVVKGGLNPIFQEIVFFKSQLKSHNPSLCCSN